MFKVIACVFKKEELSVEAFREHWMGTHRDLLLKYQDVLHITKHVQMIPEHGPLQAGLDGMWSKAPVCDGIDETTFDSEEAFRSLSKNAEAAEALKILKEDERKFVDHSKTFGWIVKDGAIIE